MDDLHYSGSQVSSEFIEVCRLKSTGIYHENYVISKYLHTCIKLLQLMGTIAFSQPTLTRDLYYHLQLW